MAETVNEVTGEIVEEPKVESLIPAGMASMVKPAEQGLFKLMENLNSLDWKKLTPPQLAILIMQKPFNASGGGQLYLNLKQALIFATRCFELGVSPFSSEVWFDPNRSSVNLTLEGKKQVARNKGIDLGPPKFEELTREWDQLPKSTPTAEDLKKTGYKKDIGIKCLIRVGNPEHKEYGEYVAWLSEWYVSKSPVWQAKPIHMLQTRAVEKCISMALGTGASDFPTDD